MNNEYNQSRCNKINKILSNKIKKLDNCLVVQRSGTELLFTVFIKENGEWVDVRTLYSNQIVDFIYNYPYRVIYKMNRSTYQSLQAYLIHKRQQANTTENLNVSDDAETNNIENSKDTPIDKENIEKYIGIVKVTSEDMIGMHISYISRFSDSTEYLNQWFDLYPEYEHVLLENNPELNSMFELNKDMTPITEEEHKEQQRARKLYNKIMKED